MYKQKITGTKRVLRDELSELYVQQTNRKFPLVPFYPYVWIYQRGLNDFDTAKYELKKEQIAAKYKKKIEMQKDHPAKQNRLKRKMQRKVSRVDKTLTEGNQGMRWGEPLSIFDSAKATRTQQRLELYLHSKGYFIAKADMEIKERKKLVSVSYKVDPGKPYIIDTTFYQIADSGVSVLYHRYQKNSLLKVGQRYDQAKLSEERENIEFFLKDNGYYDFSRAYIDFEVDTAFGESAKVAVKTKIKSPAQRGYHKKFIIDSVNFTTDANLYRLPDSLRINELVGGVNYRYFRKIYSKKILSRRVFVRKDSAYSRENTFNTQRLLANLDHFRFININYDSSGGQFVGNIFTSPLDQYQWSNEFGINVTQGYPGPFFNTSFKKRNFFGGLEIFELSARIGFEGLAAATEVDNIYRSTEIGGNASITFPQFILPISDRTKYKLGKRDPKTTIQSGYTFTERPEYTRQNANVSLIYTWRNQRRAQYRLGLTDVSWINSTLTDEFRERLEDLSNNLRSSFNPSFVSNMNLSVTWNFNNYGSSEDNSSFLKTYLESGGTTQNFQFVRELRSDGLEYYRYLKFDIDFRRFTPIDPNTAVAFRLRGGIAYSYDENEILPYEKYFFAGGSNGIRAWRPRRLGPGSYTPINEDGNLNYDLEQPGEILFEASIELRKNLFGFVDYAFFADAGNTWLIREDPNRPGAKFEAQRFYREIAVGAGLGLRFDFSFLVLRFDTGLKVYDPAREEGKRFILQDGFYDPPFDDRNEAEPLIYNIGIGYPF